MHHNISLFSAKIKYSLEKGPGEYYIIHQVVPFLSIFSGFSGRLPVVRRQDENGCRIREAIPSVPAKTGLSR